MNGAAIGVLTLAGIALLLVPRRWAPLPLLAGACYLPFYLSVAVGPFNFTCVRVLIAVGLLRLALRGEGPGGPVNALDRTLLLWAGWMVLSGLFHKSPVSALVFRLGLVYDALGLYALVRSYCRSMRDILHICQQTALLMTPLALEMVYEQLAGRNLFAVFGGVDEVPMMREGRIRANGPFGHPILAGTIGAVCLPFVSCLWRTHRREAMLGTAACIAIIFASASSGPILSAMAGGFALYLWRKRSRVRTFLWASVPAYVALDLVMKDPAYFLIARVDLAGGSTSWYRARLIQSAFEHLHEWWLVGTDYTRHWMWVVVSWSPDHTDITSHYIQMGVLGGLPLLLLFMLVLWKGFMVVGQVVRRRSRLPLGSAFVVWAFGSSLFALTVTGFSVSYFDQSVVFLYLTLAVIGSARSADTVQARRAVQGAAAGRTVGAPVAPPGYGPHPSHRQSRFT